MVTDVRWFMLDEFFVQPLDWYHDCSFQSEFVTKSSAIAVIADRPACSILTLFIAIATSLPLNKKIRSLSVRGSNNYCGSASAIRSPHTPHGTLSLPWRYILQQKCLKGRTNRNMCVRNTLVQLLAAYTNPESHNAQHHRQTDGRTDNRMMPIADHTV